MTVDIQDLVVHRGRREILHGISAHLPGGEITGVLGPSGSGKTTLMRSVVGVQRVTGGTVTVLGAPAGSPALRSRVGYVTQAPSVYDDLTVRANVAYFGAILGAPTGAVEQTLADVDLRVRLPKDRLQATLVTPDGARTTLAVERDGDAHLVRLASLGVYGIVVFHDGDLP